MHSKFGKLIPPAVLVLLLIATCAIFAYAIGQSYESNEIHSSENSYTEIPTIVCNEHDDTTPNKQEVKAKKQLPVQLIPLESAEDSINQEPSEAFVSLGKFMLTAYCPCRECCGGWADNRPVDDYGNQIVYTSSGGVAKAGRTVAADTSVLPFGTIIYINGFEYEVQDEGSAVIGNHIDIYFDDHEEALEFALQYAEIMIKVES